MFYKIEDATLIGIANAIREQYGEDSPIATTDMEEAIRGIEGSGGGGSGESILPFEYEMFDVVIPADADYLFVPNPRSEAPIFGLIFSYDLISNRQKNSMICAMMSGAVGGSTNKSQVSIYSGSNISTTSNQYGDGMLIDATGIKFTKRSQYQEQIKYKGGYTYTCLLLY